MKILFLTEHHPGSQGGIQTLGRVLKKFFQEELFFLTFMEENENFKIIYDVQDVIKVKTNLKCNPFKKFYIKKIKRKSIKEYLINKKIKELKPDVVILGFPHEVNYLEKVECKKILVQHINYSIYIKNFFKENEKLIKIVKQNIDSFIFLSNYDLEIFKERLELDKEKLKVIRHSSEINSLKNNKNNKNNNLIMVARLQNNHKRFDLAIKSMKRLPNFNLKIYGDGPDREKLERLIEKEKIENVYLMGGTNKIQEVLDEASIFIMTSDFEGYGITNIEAMRRGLPIILRNTFEAAQDIIVDNKNGVLLNKIWNEDEFIEAIFKIYNNYDYYSQNALFLSERYNQEIIKEEWIKLIYG